MFSVGFRYKEVKDDYSQMSVKLRLPACSAEFMMPELFLSLAKREKTAKKSPLHLLLAASPLFIEKRRYGLTKSDVLVCGLAYAWSIILMICSVIIIYYRSVSTFLERDGNMLNGVLGEMIMMAYPVLGYWSIALVRLAHARIRRKRILYSNWSADVYRMHISTCTGLRQLESEPCPDLAPRTRTKRHVNDQCDSRPDLALDPSEGGDTATPDVYGTCVVSQTKLDMTIRGYVETPPIQQPQGTQLISSGGGPDHGDIDSISTATINRLCWLLASSAPCHMAGDANQMIDYVPTQDNNTFVTVPNMGAMRVHGTGSVRTAIVCLDGVKHVPGLGSKNLVSTGQLARGGYTVTLAPSGCRVTARSNDHTVVVGEAHFTDESLFQVDFLRVLSTSAE